MCEEGKKISFGFSKLTRKTSIISSKLNQPKPNLDENKVELIDCFEGNSIKLKDPVKEEDKILIIPLKKQNEKLSVEPKPKSNEPLSNQKVRSKEETIISTVVTTTDTKPSKHSSNSNSSSSPQPTLDELAAKEILEDLHSSKSVEETRIFSVPLTNNPPEGEKESSLDDYENIPVEDFGMAMLRGMGWAPGKGIGKHEKMLAPTPSAPALRPKGMGLGADKVINVPEKTHTGTTEDLQMVKGGFVRIVAGPHKSSYGQIEGFDDEAGRLIVRLVLKNLAVSLNEFMIQLVSKDEFTKNSKVLNVAKYEEYKESEKNTDSLDKRKVSSENQKKSGKREENLERVSKSINDKYSKDHSSSDCESFVDKSQRIEKLSKVYRQVKKEKRSRSKSRDRQRRSRSQSRSRESQKKSYNSKYDVTTKASRGSRSYSSEEDYKRRRRSRSSSKGKSLTKLKTNKKKEASRTCYFSESSNSSSSSREYSRKHKSMKKKKRRSRSRSKSLKRHRSQKY